MADYDTTVSVQIYDDFEKIKQALPDLIKKMEYLKSTLSSISNVKIDPSSIANMVKQINKLSSVTNLQNIANITNQINKNLGNMNINSIKSLREEMARLKQEYASFVARMNGTSTLKTNRTNMSNFVKNKNYDSSDLNDIQGTRNQNITSYISQMNEGLQSVRNNANKTKKSISEMFSIGKMYWFANNAREVFRGIGNIIQRALDFTEVENYFSRAMGNMYDKAMTFQNKLSDMYGQSMSTMMQAQATYKNMIGSLGGLSDDMSYKLSETVTKMTLDFSSLYNVDFDKTVQKFQSALSKQVRPIRSVSGMDITQNVLESTAQGIGIDKSIRKMNELEKRMLIILTLMQQMRNSGAMNDFARTVEQPANQLRILQEQIKEVGRWLGSVFYGVIGNILPYINGFVMAIKEIVKAFALFVGFELPNSSGQTGTILDSYGDSMGDLNDGISDTSSGLDNAKKKAKELKKSLAGFDKLNIIQKPSSDDSSDKSSGTGGMSIDPKILDALNSYKYIFDNIHMKATDIKNQLLEWADIAKRSLDENIFKPMRMSWDIYGASITENMKTMFSDITHIASGIFDVVGEKWKPFFKSASDLFFSLLDTVTLVASSITSFFKSIWDNGGNVFLEGVFDLITATMKLAKAINDDFIKPTIRAFRDTFGVVISTVLGGILKLIGAFMTELSKFISTISKSQPIVKGLGVTLAGVFAVIQIGKFTQLWNSFGAGFTVTQKLVLILSEKSKIIKNLVTNYFKTKDGFTNLSGAWKSGVDTIKKFITNLNLKVQSLKISKTSTEGATVATGGLTIAQKLCAGATTMLQTALTFLAAHPVVAIVIALGTAVTAFALLGSKSGETTKKIEDCSQEIQDQAQEIKDYSSAVDSAVKSADEQVYATEAQIGMTEKYIDKLKGLSDEKGYVDNIEQARFLVDEINKVLPDTFELTEDGRVIQKKSNDELQKSITLTRDQAKARAYQEAYVETLKNQLLTEQKLNDQKTEYARLMDEAERQYKEYLKTAGSYNGAQKLTFEQWVEGNEALKEQKSLIATTTDELDKQSGSVKYLEGKMSDFTDTMGETIKSTGKLSDSTQKAFDNIGKSGQDNINDVIKGLSTYGKKMKETSENTSKYSKAELITIQKTRDDKVVEYGKMVRDYDLTYDQIIEKAKTSGIEFTLAEQGTLSSIVQIYKTEGKQAGDDYVNNLSTKISDGSWKISDSAKGNVLDTNEILKNVPVEYRSFVEEALSKAEQRRKEAENNVGDINMGINTSVNWSNLNSQITKIKSKFIDSLSYKFILSQKGVEQHEEFASLRVRAYASGGFPDVGQMFIARESGIPELVGSMGGRNAVANNQQIETGIEEASYRGMARALQSSGGTKGDTYIEVVTVIDGEVVDRRIEKANEKHILKTGKPLFSK